MAYAILRTKKLKTFGAISGSAKHTFREIKTENADASRTSKNKHVLAKNADQVVARFRERMPDKFRKNAVVGVEVLITASPEAFERPNFDAGKFFNDSLRWVQKSFGGKDNLVSAHVHYDEKTPHLVAYIVPRTLCDKTGKAKLNCREYLGGRAKLSALQTSFASDVGSEHGLKRGIQGSKAKHQTIKQFYAKINAAAKKEVPTLKEKPLTIFERLAMISGYPPKRVLELEKVAQAQAQAALGVELAAKREYAIVDALKMEKLSIAEERKALISEQDTTAEKLHQLESERNKLLELKMDVVAKIEAGDKESSVVIEALKSKLEAAQALNEKLTLEIDHVKNELYQERLENAAGQHHGHGR